MYSPGACSSGHGGKYVRIASEQGVPGVSQLVPTIGLAAHDGVHLLFLGPRHPAVLLLVFIVVALLLINVIMS